MKIGDEVYIHGYVDEIRNGTIIIRNVGGYFGTSRDEVLYYEEDERGYGTMNEADRKTENCSEKPNNCETCKHNKLEWYSEVCDECSKAHSNYEPQTCDDCIWNVCNYNKAFEDEPQTEEHCETCRHKDECEGATYEYKNTEWWCLAYAPIDEPQTDCAWK